MTSEIKSSDTIIKLHEQIIDFREKLKGIKKNATKGQLINLLMAIVEHPVEKTVTVLSKEIDEVYVSAVEVKMLLIHSNLLLLMEESKLKQGANNGE